MKLPKEPPDLWIVFMSDGARRSRFLTACTNHGEVAEERTAVTRTFELDSSDWLSSLKDRLVVEWFKDTINWAKSCVSAAVFPVTEIADPQIVPFPGFDRVLITYAELRAVAEDSRYSSWRTALGGCAGHLSDRRHQHWPALCGQGGWERTNPWAMVGLRQRRSWWQCGLAESGRTRSHAQSTL